MQPLPVPSVVSATVPTRTQRQRGERLIRDSFLVYGNVAVPTADGSFRAAGPEGIPGGASTFHCRRPRPVNSREASPGGREHGGESSEQIDSAGCLACAQEGHSL